MQLGFKNLHLMSKKAYINPTDAGGAVNYNITHELESIADDSRVHHANAGECCTH
jgi:hypothetical protein